MTHTGRDRSTTEAADDPGTAGTAEGPTAGNAADDSEATGAVADHRENGRSAAENRRGDARPGAESRRENGQFEGGYPGGIGRSGAGEGRGSDGSTTEGDRYGETAVGVVVPAYNESAHVGDVLESIPPYVDRIYAVDDASEDDTWDEIRRRVPTVGETAADGGASADPRIVPIRHETNQGAGGALRTGYQHALDDGIDVVVAMDADGQMDPDLMPDLLDPVVDGEADYAKGNRLLEGEHRDAMPPFRQVGNWTLTFLTKVASGYWKLMDPQNGYTAISRDALEAIDLSALPDGHDYTNDLLVRLNVAGARVADVSMPARYGDEDSTIDYAEFVPGTSATLLRSFVWRLRRRYLARDFHPLALFYGVGAASATTGVALGLGAVRRRRDEEADGGHLAVGALLALISGFFLVLWGMAQDARANEDREVRRE